MIGSDTPGVPTPNNSLVLVSEAEVDDLQEMIGLLLDIEAYDPSIIEPLGYGEMAGSLNRVFRADETTELSLDIMPRDNHRVAVVRDMIEGLLQRASLSYGEFKQIIDWWISHSREACGLRPSKVRRSAKLVVRELRPEFAI